MREAAREFWKDAAAAVRLLTVASPRARPDRHRLARAALLFPLAGALIGGGLAAWDALTAQIVPQPMRSVLVVLIWACMSRGMSLRGVAGVMAGVARPMGAMTPAGTLAIAALLVGKAVALAQTGPALVARALIIAPVLGRWALVVLAYGAKPIRGGALAMLQLGRVTFREFGWSSVMAFAIALSLADAIGLVLVIVAAVTATGIRLAAYARSGAMSSDVLGAGIEVVELAVLGVAALLSGIVAHP